MCFTPTYDIIPSKLVIYWPHNHISQLSAALISFRYTYSYLPLNPEVIPVLLQYVKSFNCLPYQRIIFAWSLWFAFMFVPSPVTCFITSSCGLYFQCDHTIWTWISCTIKMGIQLWFFHKLHISEMVFNPRALTCVAAFLFHILDHSFFISFSIFALSLLVEVIAPLSFLFNVWFYFILRIF